MQEAHHVRNTVVASEIVSTSQGVGVRDVQVLDKRVPHIPHSVHHWGGLCGDDDPKVMGECEQWPVVPNCTELWIRCVVQNAGRLECGLDNTSRADLVRQPGDLEYVEKCLGRVLWKGVTYLFRRVHEVAVSEPAAHGAQLSQVRKRKLMGNGVPHHRLPLNKLVVLGKPFPIDVREELDLVGAPVVGDNFDTKVRERNRLIHKICRLRFR